jgi:predicted nucleic acid-binding protein
MGVALRYRRSGCRQRRLSGTLILDSEGLTKVVGKDRDVLAQIDAARRGGMNTVVSAMTLVEARDPKVNQARFDWAASLVTVLPVTEQVARAASRLLASARLHGHRHAIDAVVAATALTASAPRIVLTSDPDNLGKLCGPQARVVQV